MFPLLVATRRCRLGERDAREIRGAIVIERHGSKSNCAVRGTRNPETVTLSKDRINLVLARAAGVEAVCGYVFLVGDIPQSASGRDQTVDDVCRKWRRSARYWWTWRFVGCCYSWSSARSYTMVSPDRLPVEIAALAVSHRRVAARAIPRGPSDKRKCSPTIRGVTVIALLSYYNVLATCRDANLGLASNLQIEVSQG